MSRQITIVLFVLLAGGLLLGASLAPRRQIQRPGFHGRSEVIFWHFWGGADRDVVDDVVRRFNESQTEHFVRAIAMPGNNLQAKLFLAIAGGDPPDLVNQDDPIVGDWANRGAILPLDAICSESEVDDFRKFLFPAAQKLATFDGRLFGVCNGLDIRALYYNRTLLEQHGLQPPRSIEDLDQIAKTVCPPGTDDPKTFGYLPDSRRLWAWGYVFGGNFYDKKSGQVLLNQPAVVAAAQWISGYAKWYGSDTINRFRQGDQSLPGKTFPMLPINDNELAGRYAVMMDGQWRVRDIDAFLQRRRKNGIAAPDFGVCPLPNPPDGRPDAGWVNGNCFLVPRGAKNTAGATAFIRFWTGMDDPGQAAQTCADGGWIPVSAKVVGTPTFQQYLEKQPLFQEFVRLAQGENQFPVPVIPGAPMFKRSVEKASADAMADPDQSIPELMMEAGNLIQSRLRNMK